VSPGTPYDPGMDEADGLRPSVDASELVVGAPGDGPGWWAGGPSAVLDGDRWWLAYRLRRPVGLGRGYANVVATSSDGVHFETVCVLERDPFDADSLERPALVRRPDGGWRIYISCDTPGSKHWRVDALDADDPAGFDAAHRRTVLPGDATTAVKDPVVHPPADAGAWTAWVCCHPLDVRGEEDRMATRLATSADGLDWELGPVVLGGRPGSWDQRGARVTSVDRNGRWAFYDGRASAAENWEERAALAVPSADGLTGIGQPFTSPHSTGSIRYVDAVALPDGGHRLFYEAARPDGAHDLRTQLVSAPRPSAGR
jgi:hypothetical protein